MHWTAFLAFARFAFVRTDSRSIVVVVVSSTKASTGHNVGLPSLASPLPLEPLSCSALQSYALQGKNPFERP